MGMLSVGITGLNAAQIALQTTGHNISNVSTTGYNRQEVSQTTNVPMFTGGGFIGQGTSVESVRRIYSDVLQTQLLSAETGVAELQVYADQIAQIDNLLADSSAGLSPAMQGFFNAIDEAAANPSSISARQSMLSGAEGLVSRFRTLNQRIEGMRTGVNDQIRSEVENVNLYVRQLDEINQRLVVIQSAGSAVPANDLLDQRDQIINNLNKEIRVTVNTESDGSLSVFFGSGQPLLIGAARFQMEVKPGKEDATQLDVGLRSPAGDLIELDSTLVRGGKLGGLIAFRAEMLDVAQNGLGRIASTLAEDINAQHMLGQDLTGALGKKLFATTATAQLSMASTLNLGNANLNVTLDQPSNLTTSDYRLSYTASGELTLLRLSDNVSWSGSGATQADALDNLMDNVSASGHQGFDLSLLSGAMAAGDTYLIRPARYGARDIALAVSDARNLALAAPIRTTMSASNAGTGKISAGVVLSTGTATENPTAAMASVALRYESSSNSLTGFPVGAQVLVDGATYKISSATQRVPWGLSISFNGAGMTLSGAPSDGDTFTISGSLAPTTTSLTATVAAAAAASTQTLPVAPMTLSYSSATKTLSGFPVGATVSVAGDTTGPHTITTPTTAVPFIAGAAISFNGIQFDISGTPVDGDQFTVGPNLSGVADGRNAVLMTALQTSKQMGEGTATYQVSYAQMVSLVGNKAREVNVSYKAQENLAQQGRDAIQSVSGVNLDEEAANLLRYQQAYQAAAKMIEVTGRLFDELLAMGK